MAAIDVLVDVLVCPPLCAGALWPVPAGSGVMSDLFLFPLTFSCSQGNSWKAEIRARERKRLWMI